MVRKVHTVHLVCPKNARAEKGCCAPEHLFCFYIPDFRLELLDIMYMSDQAADPEHHAGAD